MLKLVLDTNVLINGVQDDFSYAYRIIDEVIEGRVTAIMSPWIFRENTRLANRLITDEEYLDRLEDFYDAAQNVIPRQHYRLSTDRDDNKFLDAAVAGQADYIITDDADLLDIGDVDGVRIVTPEEFWNVYAEGADEETSSAWNEWAQNLGIG